MPAKPSTAAPAKAALRQRLRAAREQIPGPERAARSAAIGRHLAELEPLRDAERIFVYLAIAPEVDTMPLVRRWLAEGRRVAVPRLEARGVMEAVVIEDLASLRPGTWGIPTPPPTARPLPDVEVALCPGLGFDRFGRRLGYGGGYYDRWLARHPRTLRVGLAFACQLLPRLPSQPHDVPMQWLATEHGALPAAGLAQRT